MSYCKRCREEVPESITHCNACSELLNRHGICAMCGKQPRKPHRGLARFPQSKFCPACQKIAKAMKEAHSYGPRVEIRVYAA